ncbi:cytochrome c oxidase subunit 4 [Demequina zhanjiangensis]|uniref:Cytochrome c oxidase polypeptide 4 n=1 Tax=Demequina zhanjiangensis TaxID=3051659 RepID=A0ABT8G0K7_9MICO|nr:cytochrome c oxidase subunit 4 [Demequina sp. SYSU T00b26]MDN4472681.1 cytochrome c oxidase subunit 4 [Demequina sp. SYSU T00b26]
MKIESNIFLLPGAFFLLVAFIYGWLTDFSEMVGFPAILLTAGLALMVGIYFKMLERRHGARPEDRHDAEIEELSGDQGFYAPWSWWPLVLAAGAALSFVSLAVGWWLMVPAAIVGLVGLVGWVMEFSTGRFAH